MKKEIFLQAFGLVFFQSMVLTLGWRPYRLEISNITTYSLSDKIAVNATVTEDNKISFYANLKEDLKQLSVRIEFYVDAGDGLFDLKYINQTIDVCRFLRDKRYLPLVQIVYKFFLQQGKFPTSCPIRKNLYIGKNIMVDVEKLPPTMPDEAMYLAVTFLKKEGSVMKQRGFYKTFFRIVNIK